MVMRLVTLVLTCERVAKRDSFGMVKLVSIGPFNLKFKLLKTKHNQLYKQSVRTAL
jgi:hypothetical protein